MAQKPDMEFRDPNNINGHIKIQFEDVFGEPEDIRSCACVWKSAYRCFNSAHSCCYLFLSGLCALPIAVCWAFQYACLVCCHVWYVTPCTNYLEISLVPVRAHCSLLLDTLCAPICQTCAPCFSNIRVQTQT